MTDVTREDVLQAIDAAQTDIRYADDNSGEMDFRLVNATTAVARAQIATAYATLLVADNQPLGVLNDVAQELRAIRENIASIASRMPS